MYNFKQKLLVIHFVHTLHGGVASVAAAIINEHVSQGYEAIVVYQHFSDAFNTMLDYNIRTMHVSTPHFLGSSMMLGMRLAKVFRSIRQEYKDYKIVIHAHNVQTVGLLSSIKEIPIVCTLHSLRGNDRGIRPMISNFLYRQILKKLYKNRCVITSVSSAIADYYAYFLKDKIQIIYNGIKPMGHKMKHDKFTIAHVGNISKAKGWDVTTKGVSLIPHELLYKVEYISAGKEQDYSESDILQIFKQLNINQCSKYVGFINNAAKVLFPNVDLLVLSSKNEGLGLVLIEALSYGIPIIANPTGGIKEILIDGVNGFFASNEFQIATRIAQLMENELLYKKLSENAVKTFADKFTAKNMYSKYKKLYEEI